MQGSVTIMAKSKPQRRRGSGPRPSAPAEPPHPILPPAPSQESPTGASAAGQQQAQERVHGRSIMNPPHQSPPIDRVYSRLVVGKKARPPRTKEMVQLPAAYGAGSGNYLLELTAFYGGDGG